LAVFDALRLPQGPAPFEECAKEILRMFAAFFLRRTDNADAYIAKLENTLTR
jgi:hypothetical protein